tara:strand:+ start:1419 stop:3857 length:2439 start_codon:yes stop_codon:yes gene_type:complete
MANSFVEITPTAGQSVYTNVNLKFLSLSDLGVKVIDANDVITELTTSQFTATNTTSLTVTITDAAVHSAITTGHTVRIFRVTPVTTAAKTFADGAVLKADDLNDQVNQLLFAAQEIEDGKSTLPLDADDRYNANNKIIKNVLVPTANSTIAVEDHFAATIGYVNTAQLFGTGTSTPQAWNFSGSDDAAITTYASNDNAVFSLNHGTDRVTHPVPLNTDETMFLVEVNGVLQHPTTDYTISESGGVYSLTLIGFGANNASGSGTGLGLTTDSTVRCRNFGVSRNVFTNVDSDGNIGIGTASPQELLHIQEGDSSATASDDADTLFIENSGNAGITIGSGTTSSGAIMFADSADSDAGAIIYTHASDATENLAFRVNGATRATIDSTGKLGIGVTSPAREIDILGSGSASMQIGDGTRNIYMGTDSNNPFIGSSTAHDLRIITNATERIRVQSDGDVGIGSNSPSAKLHVTTGTSGVSPHASGDDLFIEGSGDSGITIGSGNGNAGRIFFADADSNSVGKITYDHNLDHLNIVTNGTTCAVFHDTGIIQANNSSTGRFLVSNTGSASVPVYSFSTDQNTGMYQNGSGVLAFACNGTTTLSISTTTINANTHKIANVVDPTSDQDAATKKYVDDEISPISQLRSSGNLVQIASGSTTTVLRDNAGVSGNASVTLSGVTNYAKVLLQVAALTNNGSTMGLPDLVEPKNLPTQSVLLATASSSNSAQVFSSTDPARFSSESDVNETGVSGVSTRGLNAYFILYFPNSETFYFDSPSGSSGVRLYNGSGVDANHLIATFTETSSSYDYMRFRIAAYII